MKPKHLSNGAFKRLLRVRNLLLLNQRRGKMSITGDIAGYELTTKWFVFCRENPEKVTPHHNALFFYILYLYGSLDRPKKFGLPTDHTQLSSGISNYKTYVKVFYDLVEFGFIEEVQKQQNQHKSRIVALVVFTESRPNHVQSKSESPTKASPDHIQITTESRPNQCRHNKHSINKDISNKKDNKEIESVYKKFAHLSLSDSEFLKLTDLGYSVEEIDTVLEKIENFKNNKNYTSLFLTAKAWLKSDKEKSSGRPAQNSKGPASVVSTFSQVKMRA
jgi:hypothetical protein